MAAPPGRTEVDRGGGAQHELVGVDRDDDPVRGVDDVGDLRGRRQRDRVGGGRRLAERRRQVHAVGEAHVRVERVNKGMDVECGGASSTRRLIGDEVSGVLVAWLVGVEREEQLPTGGEHGLATLAAHLLLGAGWNHLLVPGDERAVRPGGQVDHPNPIAVRRLRRQIVENEEAIPAPENASGSTHPGSTSAGLAPSGAATMIVVWRVRPGYRSVECRLSWAAQRW